MQYLEIEDQESLEIFLLKTEKISHVAFQALDFTLLNDLAVSKKYQDCLFMGCKFSPKMREKINDDNFIFPVFKSPYQLYPNKLYNKESLFDTYKTGKPDSYQKSHDKVIYDHFTKTNFLTENIRESLGRALHDHSIADAMHDFLADFDEKTVVGIMGGHSLPRTDKSYKKVAFIARELTKKGYLMISGGGPGGMEATHLGAWFADKSEDELEDALDILEEAPSYTDKMWLDSAMRVLEKYPASKYLSLGIPTWLYGHEPPTPFATHIAKFFDNSVREDAILTIAKGGLIFAPGSAGTIQEIFQDATQNHYLTQGYSSPMIFFGKKYWNEERPVFPLLKQMNKEGKYKNLLLTITDEDDDIIEALEDFYDPE